MVRLFNHKNRPLKMRLEGGKVLEVGPKEIFEVEEVSQKLAEYYRLGHFTYLSEDKIEKSSDNQEVTEVQTETVETEIVEEPLEETKVIDESDEELEQLETSEDDSIDDDQLEEKFNKSSLMMKKKNELVSIAEELGVDSSGTKSDIINRLLGE